MAVSVRRAEARDLPILSELFDGYRVFYERPSDPPAAQAFLSERLRQGDSVLFVAEIDGAAPVGFTQLYPSFTSAGMQRIFVLNDLFVRLDARRSGAGRALMRSAEAFARAEGAARLSLATAVDNVKAQALYEAEGYVRDEAFLHYDLTLDPSD